MILTITGVILILIGFCMIFIYKGNDEMNYEFDRLIVQNQELTKENNQLLQHIQKMELTISKFYLKNNKK